MHSDVERWNQKYTRRQGEPLPPPDAVLTRQSLDARGVALDLACGRGANTAYLAALGYYAIGVDCSFEALRQARRRTVCAAPAFFVADLDRLPLPAATFDLIVVVKYLNRALFEGIRQAVKPGGLVFYRTFNRAHLRRSPSFNPDFVLSPGELERQFEDFEALAADDSPDEESLSFLLARRPR